MGNGIITVFGRVPVFALALLDWLVFGQIDERSEYDLILLKLTVFIEAQLAAKSKVEQYLSTLREYMVIN